MASKSLPTPAKKEQGCFQCSRRRIICDKGEPSCTKCIKKGIDCSGLGRIRFAEGVARRGRLKDCKIPDTSIVSFQDVRDTLPTTTSFQALRWPDENRPKKRRRTDENKYDVILYSESLISVRDQTTMTDECDAQPHQIPSPDLSSTITAIWEEAEDAVEEVIRDDMALIQSYSSLDNIPSWITPIGAEARMLFSYCKPHFAYYRICILY